MNTQIQLTSLSELNQLRRQLEAIATPRVRRDPRAIAADPLVNLPEKPGTWQPPIEVRERENHFILRAELPGIPAANLNVQASRHAVLLAGKSPVRASGKGVRTWSEFNSGEFHRVVVLGTAIEGDRIEAHLQDGILTLTVQKRGSPTPFKVRLDAARPSKSPEISTSIADDKDTDAIPKIVVDEDMLGDLWSN
jgi:HSP20 family protein